MILLENPHFQIPSSAQTPPLGSFSRITSRSVSIWQFSRWREVSAGTTGHWRRLLLLVESRSWRRLFSFWIMSFWFVVVVGTRLPLHQRCVTSPDAAWPTPHFFCHAPPPSISAPSRVMHEPSLAGRDQIADSPSPQAAHQSHRILGQPPPCQR